MSESSATDQVSDPCEYAITFVVDLSNPEKDESTKRDVRTPAPGDAPIGLCHEGREKKYSMSSLEEIITLQAFLRALQFRTGKSACIQTAYVL